MEKVKDSGVVAEVKPLLADPIKRIELDDYIYAHVRDFLDLTSLQNFPVQGAAPTKEDVAARIARYEEVAADFQKILVLVAKWATTDQAQLLENAFAQLAESDKGNAGLTVWLALGWYPALYLMYSAGIAALASKNYPALAAVLLAPVEDDEGRRAGLVRPVATKVIGKVTDSNDAFKLLPGRDRNHAPRSEHLFGRLREPLEDLLQLGRRYEAFFDKFELFVALTYADSSGSGWVPAGRFAWKHRHDTEGSPIARLKEDANREGDKWAPLRCGMFAGSLENFSKAMKAVDEHVERLGWF